jgi:hypothetical protein
VVVLMPSLLQERRPRFLGHLGAFASLVNRSRRPNGTGDILKLAGDYTNPLEVRGSGGCEKARELGLKGIGETHQPTFTDFVEKGSNVRDKK